MIRHSIAILFLTLTLGLSAFSGKAATTFSNESLRYVVSYKWGLIHKDAGDATLSLRRSGDRYKVSLVAKTRPWADKFYSVRDTLLGEIRIKDLRPLSYAKITHEKKKYARDDIRYSFSGDNTVGHTKCLRVKNGVTNVTERTLTASGPVYDMLSIFYYLRQLNYDQLNKNKLYVATIFSGKKREKIKIRSIGKEVITLKDKSKHDAYHIRFNFTQDGGKKSSDDIDVWISTDSRHIPLYLVGTLPVGEVRAYLTAY